MPMDASAAIEDSLRRQATMRFLLHGGRQARRSVGQQPIARMPLSFTAPRACLATRLRNFATNRHEHCRLDTGRRHDQPEPIHFFVWVDDADDMSKRERTKKREQHPEQIHRRFHARHPTMKTTKWMQPALYLVHAEIMLI